MIFKKTISFILTIIGFLIFTYLFNQDALANDCSLGRNPDGVYLLDNANVEMVSEDIIIDVEKGFATCTFTFKNKGEARNVLMGFPVSQVRENDLLSSPERLIINNFTASINGSNIKVKTENSVHPQGLDIPSDIKYDKWYTFNVSFKENEEVIVKNTYTFSKTIYSNSDIFVGYILETGRPWSGVIGHSKVTFKMGSIKPYEVAYITGNLHYKGNDLVFEKYNLEPSYNISIVYNLRYRDKEFISGLEKNEQEKIQEQIKQNENLLNQINTSDNTILYELYRKSIEKDQYILSKYIRSRLSDNYIAESAPKIQNIDVKKSENGFNERISFIAYDEDCDIESYGIKFEPKDKSYNNINYSYDFDENKYQIRNNMYFDLYELKKQNLFTEINDFIVYITLKDSLGHTDSKTIDFSYNPAIQKNSENNTEAIANTSDIKASTDSKAKDTSEVFGNGKVSSLKSTDLAYKIILIIGSLLLIFITTSTFFLIKRKRHN